MVRKHFLVILSFILFCECFHGQTVDSSTVILDSKDTIILNKKIRSLINPRNLEIKQKKYWENFSKTTNINETDDNLEKLYKPILSIGIGTLSFFGDIGDTITGKNRIKRAPFQGGFSYTLRLVNPLTDYLDVALYAMLGIQVLIRLQKVHCIQPQMVLYLILLLNPVGLPSITTLTSYLKKVIFWNHIYTWELNQLNTIQK